MNGFTFVVKVSALDGSNNMNHQNCNLPAVVSWHYRLRSGVRYIFRLKELW